MSSIRVHPIGRALAAVAAVLVGTTLGLAPAAACQHDAVARVEVQTYNLDIGGDLSHLFDPSFPSLISATSLVWSETVASNIPARAKAVARIIALRQPDVVGLNEVSVWKTAPAVPTGPTTVEPTGPFTTRYDALASLLRSLRHLGTPYTVVAVGKTFDNEAMPLPAMEGDALKLITFSDSNVILVRTASLHHGMKVSGAQSHLYQARLPLVIGGTPLAVTRGYVTVDVRSHGMTFRVASTHLEAWGYPPLKDQVRNPQAEELAASLGASPYPVVLLGDINSRPTMCAEYRPTSPEYALDQNVIAYGTLQKAGLTEVWPALHPAHPCSPSSWTSGQAGLDNPVSALSHRIDDVFFSSAIKPLSARVDGADLNDRTRQGLWPSDHATTWATLMVRAA